MMKRDYIIPMVAVLMIVVMVVNEWQNDRQHLSFFTDVRGFINAGGRNTAADGYQLCLKINQIILSDIHQKDIDPINCEKRYVLDERVRGQTEKVHEIASEAD